MKLVKKAPIKLSLLSLLLILLVTPSCGGEKDSSTTTTSVPAAPTGLTASASTTSIALSWTAVDGATSYTLYYGTTTGVTVDNGSSISALTSTSYQHENLTTGKTYYYIVTASNDAGESTPSSELSIATTPSGVSTFTVSPGNAKNTLSWPAVDGASSYTLYHSTSSGVTTANGTKIDNIAITSYSHTGLTNNTTYYYLLTASGSGGNSTVSKEVSGTPRKVQRMFLYAADQTAAKIRPYAINMDSGALTVGTDVSTQASPYNLGVDPSGKFLYSSASPLRVYTIDQTTGAPTVSGSDSNTITFTNTAILPNGSFAYTSNSSVMTRYAVNASTGTFSSASTVASGFSALSKVLVDSTGSYLFALDTATPSVVRPYSINTSGGISAGATINVGNSSGDMALSPNDSFLYVSNGSSSSISQLSISNGVLSTIGSAVATGGSGPSAVTVDGSGLFLYEISANTLYVHTINQTTGALGAATATGAVSKAPGTGYLISEPTGRFIFLLNSTGTTLTSYSINSTTGVLTAISTLSVAGSNTGNLILVSIPWS
ncbi:MAG: beta-propeller fold lactonase family protein [Deltaproteobacteria bacterium]|nr:beta-propeller fold lactonase family protein [Deltaproteobacteria bacterium]